MDPLRRQMAKRGKSIKKTNMPRTEFQIHVNLLAEYKGYDISNLVDFTERRLILLAKRSTSPRVRNKIITLLQSYQSGDVAIAWSDGQPVYHPIERRIEPAKGADAG